MDALRLAGALLAVGLAAAHSALGERFILARLFRRGPLPRIFEDDSFTRHTLRFAWHLASVLWLGVAATLLVVEDSTALRVASLTMLACAGVTFVGSRGRHVAWAVMAAVAALAWAVS